MGLTVDQACGSFRLLLDGDNVCIYDAGLSNAFDFWAVNLGFNEKLRGHGKAKAASFRVFFY